MFYVPVSVVMVAAAIQRVASVPLKKRALALEDHVLSQFGKSIQPCVSSSPPTAAAAAATARAPGLLLLFVLLPPRWCRGSCSDSDRNGDDVAAERNDGMMLMMTTIIMMTMMTDHHDDMIIMMHVMMTTIIMMTYYREDFEQIRRATGLRQDEDIRPNDFMLAMLVRCVQVFCLGFPFSLCLSEPVWQKLCFRRRVKQDKLRTVLRTRAWF